MIFVDYDKKASQRVKMISTYLLNRVNKMKKDDSIEELTANLINEFGINHHDAFELSEFIKPELKKYHDSDSNPIHAGIIWAIPTSTLLWLSYEISTKGMYEGPLKAVFPVTASVIGITAVFSSYVKSCWDSYQNKKLAGNTEKALNKMLEETNTKE